MARLDPAEGFNVLKDRVKEAISSSFPKEGAKNVLELENIDIPDKLSVSNVGDQKSAKMNGRTWGVPVHATLTLKDKKTGRVLDRSKIKVATLPKVTNRYSYIVDGSEYQVDNQWRLKPGVYTKVQQNGELDSFFNVQGQPMHVGFDPKQRTFEVKHGGAKPPLYPIMKALGYSDDELEKAWGKDILNANMTDAKGKLLKVDKQAINFAKRLAPNEEINSFDKASEVIRQRFAETKLHPDVTSRTLGKPIDKITPEAMLRSSQRLLGVARGTEKPDVRDSLMFKEFLSTEDFIGERIRQGAPIIQRRIGNNIDRRDKVRDIVGMDVFQRPIKEFFSKVSLASTPEQTNPLKIISGQLRTTIAGEGGVKDANRITEDAKLVDPSHFGVLDPLHTPECLHPSTSVYTKRGWVQCDDLKDDDLFACRIDGRLEFHRAERIIRDHHKGKMYGMEHAHMSYLVTHNHRMWCRPRDQRTPNAGQWRFETAAQIHGKTRNVVTTHDPYRGSNLSEMIALPFQADTLVPVEVWAAFMGWYLSEGNVLAGGYGAAISQVREPNEDNCTEIECVLNRLPFEWAYSCHGFRVRSKALGAYLQQFGYCEDKFIPEELFELSVGAREELLAALLLGDGRLNARRTNGDVFHDRDTFTTTSEQLAKDVEKLIISLGYAATIHSYKDKREDRYLDVYEVRIQRRSERVVRGLRDQYTVNYDGMVYCATVPGSMLYVRKDGKCPFWTGNSVKTGVNLQLSLGARKVGNRVEIPLISAKTGKVSYVDPGKINDSVVALPDSVKRVGTKFVPKEGTTVLASGKDNELVKAKMKDVDYVVPRSSQMFSIATNMVPFISSDSPNRATMAGRHMEQAIPLKDPEAPLVQSVLGKKSFDELVGSYASHSTPTDGTVLRVGKDGIQIKGDDGKTRTVHIYDHYPLNDKKGMIHSTPLVKAGDKVTKGQVIGDTNFTKNGVYAPGKNLEVAYMPWRGYNFEDGVVISESASRKLTSEHLHKKGVSTKEAQLLGTKKYQAYYQDRLNKEQAAKLDDDGVVKPGMKVKPGDTLVAALAEQQLTTEEQKLKLLHKSLVRPYKDKAITWDEDVEGEVVEVNKRGSRVDVHVKTAEPMDVGDKLVGRHGNKGIVTMILPDHEMPKKKDGSPIEVIMNPIGTPGRMNIGQVLETAVAKIAKKKGEPFKVTNFEIDNNLEFVQNELKKAGLTDKESVIDPKTGKEIPGIQVGPQYILKMEHQVGKKMAARSRDAYDRNLVPKGGGPHGAQALGSLGIYSLLAHGSRANLREMQTYKSDRAAGGDNDELWSALQAGEMLPPPRTSFAYNKFNSYLKAMGVNTEKDGNSLNLVPLIDKQVLEMSNGELKDAGRVVKMRTLQPEKDGLFDPKVTGGHDGTNWSHIKLHESMPNPLFEKAIMSVANIRGPQFDKIVSGQAGVLPNGTIVEGTGVRGAAYGPTAVSHLLTKVDVKKDLAAEEARIQGLKGQLQNEARRRIKYLRALDKLNMKPTDAYMMQNVPVLPPNMRPIAVLDDGSLQTDDLNEIYKQLAIVNNKQKEFPTGTPQSLKSPLQADVYDHLKALTGLGGTLNRKHPGILDVIAGKEGPKTGFAQDVLIKRKQDMTMRSTIVPEPSLALDEAEIPRKAAKEMYKPFLVRELRRTTGATPLAAKKMIDQDDPLAHKALERVVQERPLLLKRDPVLHKYGIQAFKPRLVDGKAIKIHPLVCSGYNADFDGDQQINAVLTWIPDGVYNADVNFWSDRRVSMAARIHEVVPSISSGGHLVVCDLSEFPHHHDRVTKGHVDFHPVPKGVRVVAMGGQGLELAEVTGWSFHRQRKVEIITLASGRQIISDDDERAIFGLDASSLEWCRRRPSESQDQFVPVLTEVPASYEIVDTLKLSHVSNRVKAEVELNFDLGYFLGCLVGDGWVAGPDGNLRFVCFSSSFPEVLEAWKRSSLSIMEELPTFTDVECTGGQFEGSRGSYRSTISCNSLARIVGPWIGHMSEGKHLPPSFLQAPMEFKRGLLAGLWDTDGSLSWSNAKAKPQFMCSYSSKSLRLVREVQHLLRILGVSSKITSTSTPTGAQFWMLGVSTVDLYEHKEAGLILNHPKKKEAWERFVEGDGPDGSMAHSRFRLVPLPSALAKNLRRIVTNNVDHSLYVTLTKAIGRQYLSKDAAQRISIIVKNAGGCGHPLYKKWDRVVWMPGVHFERVIGVEKTGVKEDGYDLTVPGCETFMATDGVVLSNTMSAYVPITAEAVKEAENMFPSRNLFSPATGSVMYSPGHESQVGLFMLADAGKKTGLNFKTKAELEKAVKAGKVQTSDVVTVGGIKTTFGRLQINDHLPKDIQGGKLLTDLNYKFTKKEQDKLFNSMAQADKTKYPTVINKLKDLGNEAVTLGGFSFGLSDFKVHKDIRDPVLRQAEVKAAKLNLNKKQDVEKFIDIYEGAMNEIDSKLQQRIKDPKYQTNLVKLEVAAGIKGRGLRQLTAAPVLFVDGKGEVVTNPVKKSYSEGLSSGDYWVATSGGRKGAIQKVQSVAKPGYLTKQMANSTMDILVAEDDCGTSRGVSLSVDEPDAVGRYTVADLKIQKGSIPAGTMLTPDIMNKIKNAKIDKVVVRSPMRCVHGKGVCAKCMGLNEDGKLNDLGTNVGILATQSIGERGTQLAMKSFHSGGVYEGRSAAEKSIAAGGLERAVTILNLPQKVKGSAVLSTVTGKVRKVEKDPAGGVRVFIGDKPHYVPADRTPLGKLKVGATVKKGDPMTRGPVNPHELLPLTNMSKVQGHLAGELHNIYGQYGIKRRHSELVVRALSNVTKVENPGSHPDLLPGDFTSTSQVYEWNKKNQGAKPVVHAPVLRGVKTIPLDVQEDWMARLNHEHLKSTLVEAAQQGWQSNLHGMHPIPPLMHGAEFGKGTKDKPWAY